MFESLRQRVAAEAPMRVLDTARAVAGLDVLSGLAETATACNYTKPYVHDGDEISATDVRHPVVERLAGGTFVPNDIELDATTHQLVILTGPNMAGKSTYLRQVALIVLLAQAGSFVPARGADRAGRSDLHPRRRVGQPRPRPVHLHGGDEGDGAHLPRRDRRSLVVLDEIGRGTAPSTAWHRLGGRRVPCHRRARRGRRRCSRRTTTS